MAEDAPEGFVRADLGPGFGGDFGAVYLDRGRGRIGFRVTARHANPVGACHGGAMATFADMQLMAIRAGTEEGQPHSPTISLSLDYLAPAPVGAWVEAAVTLVRATRTMLFTQAVMTVDGEAVARATAIYKNPDKKGA